MKTKGSSLKGKRKSPRGKKKRRQEIDDKPAEVVVREIHHYPEEDRFKLGDPFNIGEGI